MNGQIRALAWTVHSKVTKRYDAQAVKVGVGRAKSFSGNFRRSVRAECLSKMLILRKWNRLRSSVDRRAGCKYKSLNAGQAGSLEQMQCPCDVCVVIESRVLNRGTNTRARSKVRDGVDFLAVKHLSD